MTAYSIIKTLLLPPGVIILLLAAAVVLGRGVLGRLLLFTAAALLTLLSLPVIALLLTTPLEPYPALDPRALPTHMQAILVLGAGLYSDAPEYGGNTVDGLSLERLRYAAWLHRASGLPVYVSGGESKPDAPGVGELMARVLRDEFGVPVAGVESMSRTTWENAAYSKPMLEQAGVARILLVSSAWHLPRAVAAFARTGLAVTPAPTGFMAVPGWQAGLDLGLADWLPSAHAFNTSYYALHEHLGRVWYQVREWVEGAPRAAPALTRR